MDSTLFGKCPITGNTKGLGVLRLIEPKVVEETVTEFEAAQMEWAWGLERGGLYYYLHSPLNKIHFRFDIGKMYQDGDFVLLPTHKTYMDAMDFSKRVGFCDRDEEDYSPRRPLTALGRSYRYVYVPFTQAARELVCEYPMQGQTVEDWNGGVRPDTGERLPAWVKDYRVIVSHCHPVSVCKVASNVLAVEDRACFDLTPWTSCLRRFEQQWGLCSPFEPPEWFIDTPDRPDWEDESLCSSEATGYWPFPDRVAQADARVPQYAHSSSTGNSKSSSRVLEWVKGVPRQGFVRRSARLANKSTIPDFQASPCQRGKVAGASKPREEGKAIGWLQQNGHFPTDTFTSNDWALFCYGIELSSGRFLS
ncbi:hypothetical protein HDZ31DRAFT_50080 [Schizophyllum fasciatum]